MAVRLFSQSVAAADAFRACQESGRSWPVVVEAPVWCLDRGVFNGEAAGVDEVVVLVKHAA